MDRYTNLRLKDSAFGRKIAEDLSDLKKAMQSMKNTRNDFVKRSQTISKQLSYASQMTANALRKIKLDGILQDVDGHEIDERISDELEALKDHYTAYEGAWLKADGQSESLDGVIEGLKVPTKSAMHAITFGRMGTVLDKRARAQKDVNAGRKAIVDRIKALSQDPIISKSKDADTHASDLAERHEQRLRLLQANEGNFGRLAASLFDKTDLTRSDVQQALKSLRKKLKQDLKLRIKPISLKVEKGVGVSEDDQEKVKKECESMISAVSDSLATFDKQKTHASETVERLLMTDEAFYHWSNGQDQRIVTYYEKARASLAKLKDGAYKDLSLARLQAELAGGDYPELAALSGSLGLKDDYIASTPDFIGGLYDDLNAARAVLETSRAKIKRFTWSGDQVTVINNTIAAIDVQLNAGRPQSIFTQVIGKDSVADVLKTYKKGKPAASQSARTKEKIAIVNEKIGAKDAAIAEKINKMGTAKKDLRDTLATARDTYTKDSDEYKFIQSIHTALDKADHAKVLMDTYTEDSNEYKLLQSIHTALGTDHAEVLKLPEIQGVISKHPGYKTNQWYKALEAYDKNVAVLNKLKEEGTSLNAELQALEQTQKSNEPALQSHKSVEDKLRTLVQTDFDQLFTTAEGRKMLMRYDVRALIYTTFQTFLVVHRILQKQWLNP